MATQYDPIAKDGSLNTTEATPRNIADVLAEELSGIASALTPAQLNSLSDVTISSPSDGQTLKYDAVSQKWVNANDAGGHTIENPSGTDMTQRTNLQFADAHLTDDSVNDRTEVENIKDITSADYANATEDGFYNVTDESDEVLTAADIPYDSIDSIKEKIDEVDSDIPRMKDWGTFATTAALETFLSDHNVSTGKFDGLRVGDKCTVAGYTCYIAGFDTEYNKGAGGNELTDHHISFIANFGNSKMNESKTTTGGYEGASTMQSFLTGKETELAAILGSHLKSRSCLTTNATSGGKSSGWGWNTHELTLLSETQVFGGVQWGNAFDTGTGYEKLPLFNIVHPLKLYGRTDIWLNGVGSATEFCFVNLPGLPAKAGADNSFAAVALFVVG